MKQLIKKLHTIGRRKRAIARIYMKKGKGKILIKKKFKNSKFLNYYEYFSDPILKNNILKPLIMTKSLLNYNITVTVVGGGKSGQSEAISLAVSRALSIIDLKNKKILKSCGFLTRDSREVERKKFGQKKARKQFQFSKR